jgi:hypothetical protein
VFFFSVLDLILIFLARNYINSLNDLASRSIAAISPEKDQQVIHDLVEQANLGNWEIFEKTRLEQTSSYLQSQLKPTSSLAVYFFPETLPPQSFERDFAVQELQPGIAALKKASQAKSKNETFVAYRRLKSRVENYELGNSSDPSQLSEEAKTFLKMYQTLSKLTD